MTSDRRLALMALMTELDGPINSYRHATKRAAVFPSNSDAYDTAVTRGNRALDDIEQAIRLWVTTHPEKPEPDGPDTQACAAADRAAVERAHAVASRWAMLRAYGSAAGELRAALAKSGTQMSHAERREQLAAGIYEFWNPGRRWADAHADDVTCYRADADAAMIAADALAGRGADPRTTADIYLEVAARLDAFGTKSTPEWAPYCVQAGAEVQEWAAQLAAAGQDETPTARNEGPGWYEVINPRNATTCIALVHEDGSLYLPEGPDLTAEEFHFAAARGNAHRLVRADDLPPTAEA